MFCSLVTAQGGPHTTSSLSVMFNEYLSCPHHRDLVLSLSAILQVITQTNILLVTRPVQVVIFQIELLKKKL